MPGKNLEKFHFVPAVASTSLVSILSNLNIFDNSLISAIFMSLCVFSIILAASAVLMELEI